MSILPGDAAAKQNRGGGPAPAAGRDERLAALLDELARQQRQGPAPDLDAAVRQHPDLADELRQLWAAAQLADALVPSAADATLAPAAPSGGLRPRLADRPQPAPGQDFPRPFGDYLLLRELGRGGMGVVYEARQQSLARTVALKMVLRGDLASAADRARFRTEAEAAARLVHPNIVTVYEVGEHDGQPYFAMQYVAGPTLAGRVAQGPLPPRDAARLVAQIARAVDHAHRRGILHRDLKPSNILLEKSEIRSTKSETNPNPQIRIPETSAAVVSDIGNSELGIVSDFEFRASDFSPKVTDFGLAKAAGADSLTQSGAILGTPSYMAPEQARAEKQLTPAADVYSLGAILYECLTGRPPFQAATPLDTILLVLEQDPLPPRLLVPGVPRDLEDVCLKCLHKNPARRYASAGDLAADLEAYLNGEPVAARSSGLASFFDRAFQETHHAAVLENWGLLWMWHSLVTMLLCTATWLLDWTGWGGHTVYLVLWGVGLVTWGTIFWQLRRRGGPVRFVERQIGHAWAAGVCASVGMFVLEVVMGQPPLSFTPLLAVAAGMVFLFKAGVLSGIFYIAAAAEFAGAVLIALLPQFGVLLFGAVTAACFFFPGLKYHRQRLRAVHRTAADQRGSQKEGNHRGTETQRRKTRRE